MGQCYNLYQVVNRAGNPASAENNPSALFTSKESAQDWVQELGDYGVSLEELTITHIRVHAMLGCIVVPNYNVSNY